MANTTYILGIDGGGSKTLALLADVAGYVIGRGSAGPSNYQVIGFERACQSIEQAVNAAHDAAQTTLDDVWAVCLGMAGVDRPADRERFESWAASRWPNARRAIVSDAELVLTAGTPRGWGLALVCGTGSIAFGRNAAGRRARAGGWGYLLGDEGSSYAIGLAALRAVARAADGRAAPTLLHNAILAHWQIDAPQQLIARVYGAPATPGEIAQLAALVEQVANEGDATAQHIMHAAYEELALALNAVAQQLALPTPTPCALAGGLIVHRPRVAAGVLAAAAALGLALDPVTPVAEPAAGALLIAGSLIESY